MTTGLTPKKLEEDIETGGGNEARSECLDGSKKWHQPCLRWSSVLINLVYSILAIVALVAVQKDRESLEEEDQEAAYPLALTFASLLLIAGVSGLVASALFSNRLLIAANVIYCLFMICYVPLGLGFAKELMAIVFSLLLLVPLFLQTKIVYLSRDPPDNDKQINEPRARFLRGHKSDFFDGSQKWQSTCIRVVAVLVNVALLVIGILLTAEVNSAYQDQKSYRYTKYYGKGYTEYLIFNDGRPMTYKLAFSLCASILYLSIKGSLASAISQQHLLILTFVQYPLGIAFLCSVGAYYNLPRLLALGLAMILPWVLVGKLYVMQFHSNEETDAEATEQLSDSQAASDCMPKHEIVATARKPTPQSSTGVSVANGAGGNGTQISRISPTSIFRGTALRPGLKILSINGADCRNLPKEAIAAILKASQDRITIKAAVADVEQQA